MGKKKIKKKINGQPMLIVNGVHVFSRKNQLSHGV